MGCSKIDILVMISKDQNRNYPNRLARLKVAVSHEDRIIISV